jgi:hypothetical protein
VQNQHFLLATAGHLGYIHAMEQKPRKKTGRTKKKTAPFGVAVSEEEYKELEHLRQLYRWSRSQTAGYLIGLGLSVERERQSPGAPLVVS